MFCGLSVSCLGSVPCVLSVSCGHIISGVFCVIIVSCVSHLRVYPMLWVFCPLYVLCGYIVWRYSSYSPPENRRPLWLQNYGCNRVRTVRRKPGWAGLARSTFFPPWFHHSHCNSYTVIQLCIFVVQCADFSSFFCLKCNLTCPNSVCFLGWNRVEWVITVLRFSKKYTLLLIRNIFRSSIPPKSQWS